jgi:uncharacterized protein YoxC
MSDMNSILLSILLIAGTILIVVVIRTLIKLSSTIVSMKTEMEDIKNTLVPMIKNVDMLTVRLDQTVRDINGYKAQVEASLNNIRKVTDNIYRLEAAVQQRIEPGLLRFASMFEKVQRGVSRFMDNWSKRKS